MTVRTAIAIDRLVGTPLCWILNALTHCLGLFLKRNHAPPFKINKILLIKLMGIGSIVQAMPLIEGLSRRYPQAEIRMLCFPETEIFAKRLIQVSQVFTIDNHSIIHLAWTSLEQIVAIIRWRPDLALDLEFHSKFSSLLTTLTCALNRGGLFNVTTQFRDFLYTHLVYSNPHRHICDLYNHLGRTFCVKSFRSLGDCMNCLRIESEEEEELACVLREYSVGSQEKLIVINPNAGELCLERRWPPQNFATLAQEMVKKGRVILVGSPGERTYVESVRNLITDDRVSTKVLNFAGVLSFGAFLALLKRAVVVITNDSGPAHLAALLGSYVVSLWGPGSPHTYEPRTVRHVALWENVFCSPCLYITREPPCGGNNICMQSITVYSVVEAVSELVPGFSIQEESKSEGLTNLQEAGRDLLPGLVLRN